jgi:hypothetical protein
MRPDVIAIGLAIAWIVVEGILSVFEYLARKRNPEREANDE